MNLDNTSKVISLIVVSLITLGAITVFVVDSILGRAIPDVISSFVYTIIGSSLGFSVHALGVQNGAIVATSTVNQATKDPV